MTRYEASQLTTVIFLEKLQKSELQFSKEKDVEFSEFSKKEGLEFSREKGGVGEIGGLFLKREYH